MKWSAAKELLKTFAVLALDIVGFFAIMALFVTIIAAAVIGLFAIIWFWLQLLF